MSDKPKIEIHNIGPVEDFDYTMEAPGLHVIEGNHGAGKTTILRTVQLATDGRTDIKPTKTDGKKSGEAVVAGRTIKVAKTTVRESGDISLGGLDDIDLTVLHWPKFKDAETRDRYRVAALVRLAGGTATLEDFRELLGDGWGEIVDEKLLPKDADPVELAGKIKRQIDKAAKANEVDAEKYASDAAAFLALHDGVPESPHTDREKLDADYQAAITKRVQNETRRKEAERVEGAVSEAQSRIDQAKEEYKGNDSKTAEEIAHTAWKDREEAARMVADAQAKLDAAKLNLTAKESEVDRTKAAYGAALKHEETIEGWQETIDGTKVESPTDEELLQDQEDIDRAVSDLKLFDAAEAATKAKAGEKNATELAAASLGKAKELRAAADKTQEIVSGAISTIADCPLRVELTDDGEARLVLDTDRSKTKPENFDELSDGERWKIIVPLCCAEDRMVVLPQAAYGEMSPATRLLIHKLAVQRGAYILTAQASDGELRAGSYSV